MTELDKAAQFSTDRIYRYSLMRYWGGIFGNRRYVMFIGLNPSTADEMHNDPTIRREINFAKAWGYSGLYKVNLFGYRATKPDDMKKVDDPVGPENDDYIVNIAKNAGRIIAAWGVHETYRNRDKEVLSLLSEYEIYHLGLSKNGNPKHPLYLKRNTQFTLMSNS